MIKPNLIKDVEISGISSYSVLYITHSFLLIRRHYFESKLQVFEIRIVELAKMARIITAKPYT